MKGYRILLLISMCIMSVCSFAQANADKLFLEGQNLQKTMTIDSQNKAIKKFSSAKSIYKVKAKQEMCDNQIAICNNNKKIIAGKSNVGGKSGSKTNNGSTDKVDSKVNKPKRNVTINVSPEFLDFKYRPKDGATQSVEVSGDCDGWEISEKPDWVTVSVTAGKFYVEAQENDTDSKRSGVIVVKCEDKSVNVVVNQDKAKGLNKIVDKVTGKKKK